MSDDRAGSPGAGEGRKGGRPPGSRDVLPRGVVALIQAAKQADRLGIKTDEAYGTILGVMRGTITGRHLQQRLSAAIFVLEQEIGKARQRVDVRTAQVDADELEYRSSFAEGRPIHPATLEALPEGTPQ